MKNKIFSCLLLLASCFLFSQENNFSKYVNPFIGTGGHGHTFPGATTPFGMVQLSPDTRIDGSWDGCGGYHYSDSVIYGFSHTHLSGTGCSDYGDIMLMPTTQNSTDNKIYSSRFLHNNEKASAGFYAVHLDDDNIDVELTSTTRVGMHKYNFHNSKNGNVVLDLTHRDKLLEGEIKQIDDRTIQGFRRSEAWAANQLVYYYITFSKPISKADIQKNEKAIFSFELNPNENLFVKVSISSVDCEGAKRNMQTELTNWDFEKTKKDAETLWNKELSKIEVKTDDTEKLKIFYTALYHTMIQPNIYNDVDGKYRGRDKQVHIAEGFNYYSVFSLWDTFRAAHPLYTIIDQKRTLDFIKTFLAQYEQGGRLPVWELSCNETDCMIGYHSVSVIADAAVKGINQFDMNLAFEAMKKSATWNHLGLPAYAEQGFLSMDDEHESVSKTLEYAYDDWCIAQMAKLLNKDDDYNTYMKRSQSWKNLFDSETGFMRPRKNGGWLTPFEPREVNNNFTEGNSWQYSFFVPQDIYGLIEKMGGAETFEKKLDELFTTNSQTTGREQADITGLIGQYAHGNEPSHHMAYLYNYIGKPWKTQERVHQILTDFYKNSPDGLIGNEDCGQMSAWYVLSSIGVYQVCPGATDYNIGNPLFNSVKVHLENGNIFSIETERSMDKNIYIKSVFLNGNDWVKNSVIYEDIISGASIKFSMDNKPNTSIPFNTKNIKPVENIVESPIIQANSKVFRENMNIELKGMNKNYKMYYTTDGSAPSNKSKLYSTAFNINQTTTINAIAVNVKGEQSSITSGTFYKLPHPNWKIKINSTYNPQYTAGGNEGIIDGIRGTENWRKGEWQGYQAQDFEAIIDMQKETEFGKIGAEFLQDTRAWIVMPTKVEFEISNDGKTFTKVLSIENNITDKDYTVQMKNFEGEIKKQKARYIKVKAYNYGKLPEWHQGAGGDAFIFVDEIWVE